MKTDLETERQQLESLRPEMEDLDTCLHFAIYSQFNYGQVT